MSPQSIKLSIPGKTFLGGEYAALFSGPSLVLATHPNFEFTARRGQGRHCFHGDSPAGKYISRHRAFFDPFDIEFKTPPNQAGGFGGSTAEFIGVYLLKTFWSSFEQEKWVDLRELHSSPKSPVIEAWQEYRSLFEGETIKPSGADMIAQMLGGLTVFSRGSVEVLNWPFLEKDVFLFKTSRKVPTHDHLAQLKITSDVVALIQGITVRLVGALQSASWPAFIAAQKDLSQEFHRQNLWSQDTAHLVEDLLLKTGVEWARGCGSLGADVIAVFANKNQFDPTSVKDLKFVASLSENLSSGVMMELA